MAEAVARGLPIPGRLNLALLAGASATSAALLYFASHADSVLTLAVCAIAFSFTANTLFSLLHESVHGLFSPNPRVNDWAGRIAAAWFPTGLSVQRAFHLTHHRNNRSRLEQFDVLHEGDVKWLKYAQWYSILTGVYWAVAVLGVLVYLLVPRALQARMLRSGDSKVAEQTSSVAYLAVLDELDPVRARLEILLSFGLQAALCLALDFSLAGWLACYAAFALSWSSLQYTDHAFSPLDARNGAWNLTVGPIGRFFFLEYHSHLAHHRNVHAPWIHLHTLIVPGELRPGFFEVLREAWRGPRRIGEFPDFSSRPARREALEAIDIELLCASNLVAFGRRHPRYWLIALGLLWDSVPHWRATRVLRTGFCFLQAVDDLLDGDRPSEIEPLRVTTELAAAIASGRYGNSDMMRLANAFIADLRQVGGDADVRMVLALIEVMQRDRRRAKERALWRTQELREHHRATFRLSLDLMLVARRSRLRASDVPELVDALGWCSTMRDLRQDLGAGLVNVPRELLDAARAEGVASLDYDALVATRAVRGWIASERETARRLLDATKLRLSGYGKQPGLAALRIFERSIRGFLRRRLLRLYPFLDESVERPQMGK